MTKDRNIYVTKTFLPPMEEYVQYLQNIWETNQIANNGPLVQELENKLKKYLGVKHFFFVSNGTIALQIAIKALDLQGEIITTPFSYVATTSSILWEGCQPVFVDIHPNTLTINPNLIERAITAKTIALLPTHVYGYPCDVEFIEKVAKKNHLSVIYDAAHAFGVKFRNRSILDYGDISILSFHATKLFHTVEGGALITGSDELAHKIRYLRNFGHRGKELYWGVGINGKNTEFHAAMGLCMLPYVDMIISARKGICELYDNLLSGLEITRPQFNKDFNYNFSYYPILLRDEKTLLRVKSSLEKNAIYPRRYFYPSLNNLPYIDNQKMPVSENVAERVLCLPLYYDLSTEDIKKIIRIIKRQL